MPTHGTTNAVAVHPSALKSLDDQVQLGVVQSLGVLGEQLSNLVGISVGRRRQILRELPFPKNPPNLKLTVVHLVIVLLSKAVYFYPDRTYSQGCQLGDCPDRQIQLQH